jgi:hypothetical protein
VKYCPKKPSLLILDLDETLIHSSYCVLHEIPLRAKRGLWHLYERPFLMEFLVRQSQHHDLAIWSASKAHYVRWVLRNSALQFFEFEFIHTRKHCKLIEPLYQGSRYLKMCDEPMLRYDSVRFLDDTPSRIHPVHLAEKAPEFRGCPADAFLRDWV